MNESRTGRGDASNPGILQSGSPRLHVGNSIWRNHDSVQRKSVADFATFEYRSPDRFH